MYFSLPIIPSNWQIRITNIVQINNSKRGGERRGLHDLNDLNVRLRIIIEN